jgi:hypothetical protein
LRIFILPKSLCDILKRKYKLLAFGALTVNQPVKLDLSKTRTFPVWGRRNLTRIDNLQTPGVTPAPAYDNPALDILAGNIKKARAAQKPVILFYGAHVIKCGLSRYLIALAEKGFITHFASNGAGGIHDFELAFLGGTSEHVPTAIEDGSFGMWEETGRWMNEAVSEGAGKGLGYGQSLYQYVNDRQDRFPYLNDCVFYRAQKIGVPVTYHITIGTDIIHQHPACDFAALGAASGVDFQYFCGSVAQLEGGVHMNAGSAVTGAEVFLKALSIVRNQGFPTQKITTANFDMIPLGDYTSPVADDHFH